MLRRIFEPEREWGHVHNEELHIVLLFKKYDTFKQELLEESQGKKQF
jgi:hypothetical protein